MNTLEDKINYLSNHFAVTESELTESLLLESPFVIDTDLYLSIQTIMMDVTRETPKRIFNFINQVLKRVDIGMGFENTMYRIYHKFKKYEEKEGLDYLVATFGKFNLGLAVVLLDNIDLIEEAKFKIE